MIDMALVNDWTALATIQARAKRAQQLYLWLLCYLPVMETMFDHKRMRTIWPKNDSDAI